MELSRDGSSSSRPQELWPKRIAHKQSLTRQSDTTRCATATDPTRRIAATPVQPTSRFQNRFVGQTLRDPTPLVVAGPRRGSGRILERKGFRLGHGRLPVHYAFDPGRRAAMVSLAATCDVTTGAGADGVIACTGPIGFVMPAAMAGQGEVRARSGRIRPRSAGRWHGHTCRVPTPRPCEVVRPVANGPETWSPVQTASHKSKYAAVRVAEPETNRRPIVQRSQPAHRRLDQARRCESSCGRPRCCARCLLHRRWSRSSSCNRWALKNSPPRLRRFTP